MKLKIKHGKSNIGIVYFDMKHDLVIVNDSNQMITIYPPHGYKFVEAREDGFKLVKVSQPQ